MGAGHSALVHRLVEAGCDLDKPRTNNGATPLFGASQKGDIIVVDQLLSARCGPADHGPAAPRRAGERSRRRAW